MKNAVGVEADQNVLGETNLDLMIFSVILKTIIISIIQRSVGRNNSIYHNKIFYILNYIYKYSFYINVPTRKYLQFTPQRNY